MQSKRHQQHQNAKSWWLTERAACSEVAMAERCIIIPVYNHAAGIRASLERLAEQNLPCIVVDDGSDIDCAAVIDEMAEEHAWVEVVRHAENRGKGAAVKTALIQAHQRGYSHALQIDADEQHDVRDIPALLGA